MDLVGALEHHAIPASRDGRRSWRDNVFVERLWQSIRNEALHLYAYESVSVAPAAISRYVTSYNIRRLQTSRDLQTPDSVYSQCLPVVGDGPERST